MIRWLKINPSACRLKLKPQDAVKIGVDLLVAADVVEPRHYRAILDGVEQFGPYFVIAPGLAMPHGRPEEGVKKTGFALVTLKSLWCLTTKITTRWISSSPWRRSMPTLTRSGHHADRQPV